VLERDYAALVAQAVPVIAPGGWLLACANTHSLSTRSFVAQLRAGLAKAGVPGARLGPVEHEPTLDFPVAPGAEPYLKICRAKLP
jgi:23S rRNA G2069 N7-methylase RlmK/C1962 C5-methylase RlmI